MTLASLAEARASEKVRLRKEYYALFEAEKLTQAERQDRDRKIAFHLLRFLCQKKPVNLLAYKPLKTELKIPAMISHLPCRIFTPFTRPEGMLAYDNKTKAMVSFSRMNMVIVPGLFVSPEGYRLGRGKGYYDRALRFFPIAKTVFVCRDWQIRSLDIFEDFDRRVGAIISESGIKYCYQNSI